MCDSSADANSLKGLYLHILPLYQYLDELLHRPLFVDGNVKRFSSAYRTILSLFMLEREGVYTISTDQHEVVIEVCGRTCGDLECLVTA